MDNLVMMMLYDCFRLVTTTKEWKDNEGHDYKKLVGDGDDRFGKDDCAVDLLRDLDRNLGKILVVHYQQQRHPCLREAILHNSEKADCLIVSSQLPLWRKSSRLRNTYALLALMVFLLEDDCDSLARLTDSW